VNRPGPVITYILRANSNYQNYQFLKMFTKFTKFGKFGNPYQICPKFFEVFRKSNESKIRTEIQNAPIKSLR
jgi:hypothetical protein